MIGINDTSFFLYFIDTVEKKTFTHTTHKWLIKTLKVKINVFKCGKMKKQLEFFITSCAHFSNPFVSFYELYLILSYTRWTKMFGFAIKPYHGGLQVGSLKYQRNNIKGHLIKTKSKFNVRKRSFLKSVS